MHVRTKDGLTIKENNTIFDSLEDLLYTNPNELLTQHQYLLLVDPEQNLGKGPPANKQVWILRMEAAILAKEKVNKIGIGGSKQAELDEGGRVDGELRESEEQ